MKIQSNKVLVQIGTNDGADEFNRICRHSMPSMVILVEPNKLHNPSISTQYGLVKNVHIENVAITDVEKGIVTLVIPKGKGYSAVHFSLLPMDDWGDDFEKIEAPSMTFSKLCEKYGISRIHYLQTDTEGFDTEIIKTIDFDKIEIDIIKYEKWTFPTDSLSRHGEKANSYGLAGMEYVSALLKSKGYVLFDDEADILATNQRLLVLRMRMSLLAKKAKAVLTKRRIYAYFISFSKRASNLLRSRRKPN